MQARVGKGRDDHMTPVDTGYTTTSTRQNYIFLKSFEDVFRGIYF